MGLMPGIFEPGCAVTSQQAVVANILSVLPAATGRRIVGVQARQNATFGTPATGALLRGLSLVQGTTNVVASFALTSGENVYYNFGPGGVDCSGGACFDWEAGSMDLNVFYIDVT